MMADPAKFRQMLIDYDRDNVPIKVIRHVQKNYTEHPQYSQYFVPERAATISMALHAWVQWISGLVLYRSILE